MEYLFNESRDCSNGDMGFVYENNIDIEYKSNNVCINLQNLALLVKKDLKEVQAFLQELIDNEQFDLKLNLRYYNTNTGSLTPPINKKLSIENDNNINNDLHLYYSLNIILLTLTKFYPNHKLPFLKWLETTITELDFFTCQYVFVMCGCNESILNLKLGDKFKIVKLKHDENNDLFKYYWNIENSRGFSDRFENAKTSNKNEIICIIYKDKIEKTKVTNAKVLLPEFQHAPFFKQIVEDTRKALVAIRLITHKPIWIQEYLNCFLFPTMSIPFIVHEKNVFHFDKNDLHNFSKNDIDKVNSIIDDFESFKKNEVLILCIQHYDSSFFVEHRISFIQLVTCLEILFHPGDKDELKNRIARNLSVFMGESIDESKSYFKEIGLLYDMRSKLVHTGQIKSKGKTISEMELLSHCNELRKIVSMSILKYKYSIIDNNISRDSFFTKLTESGFGSDPFKIINHSSQH